jgi:hypothetical protein
MLQMCLEDICWKMSFIWDMQHYCRERQAFMTFWATYCPAFMPPAAKNPDTICLKLDALTTLLMARRTIFA